MRDWTYDRINMECLRKKTPHEKRNPYIAITDVEVFSGNMIFPFYIIKPDQ